MPRLQVKVKKCDLLILHEMHFRYCQNGNYQMCVPHHVYGFHQVLRSKLRLLSRSSVYSDADICSQAVTEMALWQIANCMA